MLGGEWVTEGPLDGWCTIRGQGWFPVEIKKPERKGKKEFTEAQIRATTRWRLVGAPWLVWYDSNDVLESSRSK
jgi:hypothetical protein